MNSTPSRSLINLLLESGVPSNEEAAQLATNLNGGSWVGQVLDSGKVDEQRFLGAIGNFFRVPVVSIDAKKIDRATLSVLPSRFVFQHHILPIEVKENSVVLATYDLFNSIGRQLAAQLLKKPAEWVLVPRAQLLRAMKTLYGVGAETFDEILKTNRSFEALQDTETAIELNADDPEASVVKFVNQIIREAIFERATDIHVEPLENDLRIRYRIDGILHEVAVPPQLRVLQSAIISRLKVMSHMDIAERRLPQDGRMTCVFRPFQPSMASQSVCACSAAVSNSSDSIGSISAKNRRKSFAIYWRSPTESFFSPVRPAAENRRRFTVF